MNEYKDVFMVVQRVRQGRDEDYTVCHGYFYDLDKAIAVQEDVESSAQHDDVSIYRYEMSSNEDSFNFRFIEVARECSTIRKWIYERNHITLQEEKK